MSVVPLMKKEPSIGGSGNHLPQFQHSPLPKHKPRALRKSGGHSAVPLKDVDRQSDDPFSIAPLSSSWHEGIVSRRIPDSRTESPTHRRSPDNVVVLSADEALARYLQTALHRAGYATFWATTTSHVFSISRQLAPSLVLVDCRIREWPMIRTEPTLRHVLLMAVASFGRLYTESHCLSDLERGMDGVHDLQDGHRLLVAKVGAYLRRAGSHRLHRGVYQVGAIEFDGDTHEVTIAGQPIHLSTKPLAILAALIQKPGKVFTRRELSDLLWGPNFAVCRHTLDVHVHALRRQLDRDPDRLCRLVTIKGVGFKLKVASITSRTPPEEFVRGQDRDLIHLHHRARLRYLHRYRRRNGTPHPERLVKAAAGGIFTTSA